MVRNALVIGGGIGGLAAAAALARKGVAVTLVEQAAKFEEVGAGIQVSPNGLAVLRALGLDAALASMGAVQAQAVELQDYAAGKTVARLDLARLKDQRYLFVHRADITALLARAARQANVSMELGRRALSIKPGDVTEVYFEDGGVSRSELVVCADGLHSVGRPAINGATSADFTGQVAWRAIVPVRNAEPVATVTMGPGRHIVSYPLRNQSVVNLVAVQERQEWADEGWHHADDPANLRAAFEDFGGPVRSLLDRVEDVSLWGLFRHPVAETWVKKSVVLLGDAAHPTVPFLAQGANLALEDAWVLSEVVTRSGDLARYQDIRKSRAQKVVAVASANAWKYHLHHGPVRWAAHRALTLGSTLAPGLMMNQFKWLYGHDVTRVQV